MSRAHRIAAVVLALSALVGCGKHAPGVQRCPARFEGLPRPGDYREFAVPAADVPARCHELGSTMPEPLGCYSFTAHIAIVPSCATDPLICEAVTDHERCHAAGWPADHPL